VSGGATFAINGQTGAIKWSKPIYSEAEDAPIVGADGTVYIVDYSLYALDPATGNTKWTFAYSGQTGSPSIGADGTLYVPTYNGILYAIK
jgi:outer membrane protein assembly factor BamB